VAKGAKARIDYEAVESKIKSIFSIPCDKIKSAFNDHTDEIAEIKTRLSDAEEAISDLEDNQSENEKKTNKFFVKMEAWMLKWDDRWENDLPEIKSSSKTKQTNLNTDDDND